ncbi:aminoacyltransferase [Streptococcus suis]|nr:aminoacyltransferase [Streptococcus suis]
MTFCQISKEEFLKHCRQVKEKSFFQSEEMSVLLTKRGYDIRLVGYRNAESEVVISSLLFCKSMVGGLYMELNSGPLITDETYLGAFYQSLKNYAKSEGVLELVIKPFQTYQIFDSFGKPASQENAHLINLLEKCDFQHDGFQTGYPNGEPVWHYVKDLQGYSSTSLLQSYNKNSIRNIKNAEDYSVIIRSISKNELSDFKKIIEETGIRQGFLDKDLDYYDALFEVFGKRADFMVAELDIQNSLSQIDNKLNTIDTNLKQYKQKQQKLLKQREILQSILRQTSSSILLLACTLIIYDDHEATYLFGGSYSEFQRLSAPFLLQYKAMLQAMSRNIYHYNFLGIQGIFDGSDGVLRFKQNFNGYILRKAGTFRYYPYPIRYKILQIIKKIVK